MESEAMNQKMIQALNILKASEKDREINKPKRRNSATQPTEDAGESETANLSDYAYLKHQKTYEHQIGTPDGVSIDKSKTGRKIPYSNSFFGKQESEPTTVGHDDILPLAKLLTGSKKVSVTGKPKAKKLPDSKKEKEPLMPLKARMAPGLLFPTRRTNSPPLRTEQKPVKVVPTKPKIPLSANPAQTPTTVASMKKIMSQLKSSTAMKAKFNLNLKDLTALKPRPPPLGHNDHRGDLSNKVSFKSTAN